MGPQGPVLYKQLVVPKISWKTWLSLVAWLRGYLAQTDALLLQSSAFDFSWILIYLLLLIYVLKIVASIPLCL